MIRLCFIFLILIVGSVNAQYKTIRYGLDANVTVSSMDCNRGFGGGLGFMMQRKHKSKIGIGGQAAYNYVTGGPSSFLASSPSTYGFRSHTLALGTKLDYSFLLFKKKKWALEPSLAGGMLIFVSQGYDRDIASAQRQYAQFGAAFYTPVYENDVLTGVSTEKNGLSFYLAPGGLISYEYKRNYNVYFQANIFFATSDDVDALNLPTPSNKGNDVMAALGFGVIKTGFLQKRFKQKY